MEGYPLAFWNCELPDLVTWAFDAGKRGMQVGGIFWAYGVEMVRGSRKTG